MRVTALRYERIARIGRFENQKLGVEVTLDEGDKPAAALRRAKRFVFRGLGLKLTPDLLRGDDDAGAAPGIPGEPPPAIGTTPSTPVAATPMTSPAPPAKPAEVLPADLEDWTNRMVELGAAQQVTREKVLKAIERSVKLTGRQKLAQMSKPWLEQRERAATDRTFNWETGEIMRTLAA